MRQSARYLLVLLVLAVWGTVIPCTAQTATLSTNNVSIYLGAFGQQNQGVTRITVQAQQWGVINGTFVPNTPFYFSRASSPTLTNASPYVVLTNLICGVTYQVWLYGYSTYTTNFNIPAYINPDSTGTINAGNWICVGTVGGGIAWTSPQFTNYLIGMGVTNIVSTNGPSMIIGQTLFESTNWLAGITNGQTGVTLGGTFSGTLNATGGNVVTNAQPVIQVGLGGGTGVNLIGGGGSLVISNSANTTPGTLNMVGGVILAPVLAAATGTFNGSGTITSASIAGNATNAALATNVVAGIVVTNPGVVITSGTTATVSGNNANFIEWLTTDLNPFGSEDETLQADTGNNNTNYFDRFMNNSTYVPGASVIGGPLDYGFVGVGRNYITDIIGGQNSWILESQPTTNGVQTTNVTINAGGLMLNTGTFSGNGGGLTNLNTYNPFGLKWQKTTANFVSPLTSPEWAFNYMTSVSFRTNVYYIGENGSGTGFGLNMADDVPNGTTNITVSISVHSLTGSAGTVAFQWARSSTWDSYFATNLAIPTGWTNYVISFPTNADTLDAGLLLRDHTIAYAVSNNLTLTYSPAPTNVVLANPFTRYYIGPNDVLGDAGSVMTASETYNLNLFAGAYDVANRFSSRSWIEFETDATNVVASVRCPAGQGVRFSIEYNGAFVSTNMAILNGNHISGLMYLPVQPNTNGGYATVKIFNAYASMDYGPNVVKAIYFPQGSHFKMLSTHEPKSTTLVLSDSIDCSLNVTTGGFENDMWRAVENFIPTRVINLASSGSSLYQTWSQAVSGGADSTSMRRQVVCKAVAEADPDTIFIAFNSNDWANNYYGDTTNGYTIDLNNMVNVFHGICPKARIMIRTPIVNTAQSGSGTLSAYGDAVMAVAAENSDFCTGLDARNWLVSGDLADGAHPSETGAMKLAFKYILALWTNNAVMTGLSKDSLLKLPFESFTPRAVAPPWQYIGITNQWFTWYSNSTPSVAYSSYYDVNTNLVSVISPSTGNGSGLTNLNAASLNGSLESQPIPTFTCTKPWSVISSGGTMQNFYVIYCPTGAILANAQSTFTNMFSWSNVGLGYSWTNVCNATFSGTNLPSISYYTGGISAVINGTNGGSVVGSFTTGVGTPGILWTNLRLDVHQGNP